MSGGTYVPHFLSNNKEYDYILSFNEFFLSDMIEIT